MVLGYDGVDGLVLRYGFFYGPGTYYADDGSSTEDVRRRRMPIVGKGSGVFSFIHVDDAADATVAAVERGAPGVYNVDRRRAGADARVGARFGAGRRRQATTAGAGVAGEVRGRQGRVQLRRRAARRLE